MKRPKKDLGPYNLSGLGQEKQFMPSPIFLASVPSPRLAPTNQSTVLTPKPELCTQL